MIKAKPDCCEEAALGMGDAYFPCNKPATKLISVNRPGSSEGPYRMCDACADHSVRNRGMKEIGPYSRALRKRDLGDDTRPTGKLRLLRDNSTARLQQEWAGSFGTEWFDIPAVEVPYLPPGNEGEDQ
jgi:hypothetical protein